MALAPELVLAVEALPAAGFRLQNAPLKFPAFGRVSTVLKRKNEHWRTSAKSAARLRGTTKKSRRIRSLSGCVRRVRVNGNVPIEGVRSDQANSAGALSRILRRKKLTTA
jgi:hypothetical protein